MAKTKYDERTRDQIASDVLKEKGLFGAIGTYLSGDFPQSESLKDPQGRVIRRQKGMDILKQRQAEGKKRAAELKRKKEQQIAKNEEARKERIRAREEAIRKTVSMATGESAKQKAMSQAVRRAKQAESARQSTGVLRSSANPAKPKPPAKTASTKPKPPTKTASTSVKTTSTKPKPQAKTKPTVKATTPSSISSKPATKTKTTGVKTEVAKAVEKNKDKDKKPKRVRRANIALARKTRTARRAGGGMMKSKMASKGGAKGGKRMPTGMKKGGPASKFPDLSGDGKVTQKDILMGKGVIGGRGLPKKPAKPKAGGRSSDAIKKARTAKMDEMKDRLKASKMGPGKTKMEMANAKKKAGGGMMKSKMSSKGGVKGGRMPGGMQAGGMMKSKGMAKGGAMKKKGYAMGGSVNKKGMAKGGAMKKKGYAMGGMTKKGMAKGGAMTKKGMAKGGSVRRNTKPRGVGAALRGFGKALKK